MTEVAGTDVAQWVDDDEDSLGLEDIGAGDVIIPRLQIDHKTAEFKDNLSGWRSNTLTVVLLGMVKQRIMWSNPVEDGDKPLCKSPDNLYGFPNQRMDLPADKRFPWEDSNFEPSQAVPVEIQPRTLREHPDGWTSNGLDALPCAACRFKDWGKDRHGKSVPPPCTEQHTFPVIYQVSEDTWTTALLTLQRTGIKPSKSYISSFAQSKKPMFTAVTKITLTQLSRGSVEYAVPELTRLGDTDPAAWQHYADTYRSIRELIRSAPRRYDESEPAAAPSANVNSAPTPAADVTGAAAPVASTPPTTPPPTPAPAPTPPPTPTPTPAPQAAAAAPPPPPPAADNDDLPF